MKSRVIIFGSRKTTGDAKELGFKGANLMKIDQRGVMIPRTVIMPVDRAGKKISKADVGKMLSFFGKEELVSVRMSPVAPQPGLMHAAINLGMNDRAANSWINGGAEYQFVYDAYARMIVNLSQAAGDIPPTRFMDLAAEGISSLSHDPDKSFMAELIRQFKTVWKQQMGCVFPETRERQMELAIEAGMKSWNSELAAAYRKKNGLSNEPATALIIQAMVMGNNGDHSCIGCANTRDPRTGENHLTGEFGRNSQGRLGMTLGINPLNQLSKTNQRSLSAAKENLEKCFKAACDFDFVIERDRLYVLKAAKSNQTPQAMIRAAAELAKQKIISHQEAIELIKPQWVERLLTPQCDPAAEKTEMCSGFAASPGAAWGYPVFSAAQVVENPERPVILVRVETEASDVGAMGKCAGVLTSSGGMTSHAAVVARAMGIPCVVGATKIRIDAKKHQIILSDGSAVNEEEMMTVDGSSGKVYRGQTPIVTGKLPEEFNQILKWAKAGSKMKILANADTPADAKAAVQWGAQGIGLCRTEHMFFDPSRIDSMRRMILAETVDEREKALAELLSLQRDDFMELFSIMKGLPVTVRLLDPPLNEFLPKSGLPAELQERADKLAESNPMLGHRGCRLYITYPEIARMQVRAILSAACRCKGAMPRIMIPLTMDAKELAILRRLTQETAQAVFAQEGRRVNYEFGTMIETPRAALLAGELAMHCDFMSFGTNDLTQMTLGISRDDAGKFLGAYVEKKLFLADPFETVDADGVGLLMKHAIAAARKAKPKMPIGICGEHAGDAASIPLFKSLGLDYLSCSPRRIPIARLAAGK